MKLIENVFVHIPETAPWLAEYLHELPSKRCLAVLGDHFALVLCDCCKHVAAEALPGSSRKVRTKRSGKIGLMTGDPNFTITKQWTGKR